ncbi:MAG: hypothetical protein RLZZ28_253 [Bacteroidota bacterium]|jgi:D-alanine-D-alanine ligase
MKICVLQPDYSTSAVDYQYYDPPRNLSHLLPDATIDHVFLNKLTTYKQLKSLQYKGYDIFVNLCEGYLEWEVPSIDVIQTLELLNLPYTGPTVLLYDPPKELMKYVAFCAGVDTPAYALIEKEADIISACDKIPFPIFVKPAKAGDSLGVDEQSLIHSKEAFIRKVNQSLEAYPELLAEEYIDGREFTVLVAANANGKSVTGFQPVEYIFPKGFQYKTYALKTAELHPDANIPCKDPVLSQRLKEAAVKIFRGFNGEGYARLDFRMNAAGRLCFLEINFTCSVFYSNGYEGSADFILQFDGIGQAGFLKQIIAEGMARYARKQKKYAMKGNAINGYGIYAKRPIAAGEKIFTGEGRAQRIITKRNVAQNWEEEARMDFRRYAYPLSREVFLLWDDNPAEWAPQNHSCNPNTGYDGLDVVALKDIGSGEELTLDYAGFLDEQMEPFQCHCNAANCRGWVAGTEGNSITQREAAKSC